MRRRSAPHQLAAVAAAAIALAAGALVSQRSNPAPTISHPIGKLAPTPGPNSDGYVAGKRAYLSRLAEGDPDKPAAALTSFARLLRAGEAEQLLTGHRVGVVFVTFPGGRPEALKVPTTIAAAVAKRAADSEAAARAEIAALEARHDPASGPLVADRERQLAGTRPDCACIYAAVIERSTVGRLASLQRSSLVRLVDVPEPLTDDLSGWQLTPIYPSLNRAVAGRR
jgi:hypothetical protein